MVFIKRANGTEDHNHSEPFSPTSKRRESQASRVFKRASRAGRASRASRATGTTSATAGATDDAEQLIEFSCGMRFFVLFNALIMGGGIFVVFWSSELLTKGDQSSMDMTKPTGKKVIALVPTWTQTSTSALGTWSAPLNQIILLTAHFLVVASACGLLLSVAFTARCTLPVHAVYILLIFISMYGQFRLGSSILLGGIAQIEKNAKATVLKAMNTSYRIIGEDIFSVTINVMMLNNQCCGVSGYFDFLTMDLSIKADDFKFQRAPRGLFIPEEGLDVKIKIPPACCKESVFSADDPEIRFQDVLECATSKEIESFIYTEGCLSKYFAPYEGFKGIRVMCAIFALLIMEAYLIFYGITQGLERWELEQMWEEPEDFVLATQDEEGRIGYAYPDNGEYDEDYEGEETAAGEEVPEEVPQASNQKKSWTGLVSKVKNQMTASTQEDPATDRSDGDIALKKGSFSF